MQHERLQNMKRHAEEKIKQAELAGDASKAESIRQEMREMMKKAQEMAKGKEGGEHKRPELHASKPPTNHGPDAPMPPDEIGRKLRHLHAAMEQLMAGGFQDAAAQLRPMAERLERQLHNKPQGAPEELQNLRREVSELRDVVRRLQGQREGQREGQRDGKREGQREGEKRE